jgi:hypothetical protein
MIDSWDTDNAAYMDSVLVKRVLNHEMLTTETPSHGVFSLIFSLSFPLCPFASFAVKKGWL